MFVYLADIGGTFPPSRYLRLHTFVKKLRIVGSEPKKRNF